MANGGLFNWIRESVRRSVLLGVSDAVEQLGTPADSAELHPQLASVLRERAQIPAAEAPPRLEARPQRKRLGRSLDQINRAAPTPADESPSA